MKTKTEVTAAAVRPQDPNYPYGVFELGQKVNISGYTDKHPGTIVGVSRNGTQVSVRRDKFELAQGSKPEVALGGFCGHVTNQRELQYDITEDPGGHVQVHTLRKWRGRYCWTLKGCTPDGRMSVAPGWAAYYDYNF